MRTLPWLIAAVCLAAPLLHAASTPVILDTDIGDDIDDALALALARQSPELNIRAIVTVLQQGERRADQVVEADRKLYGPDHIRVETRRGSQ